MGLGSFNCDCMCGNSIPLRCKLCLQVRAVFIFIINILVSSGLFFGTVFFNVLSLIGSQQN